MKNSFEPINSDLLGEEMSNFTTLSMENYFPKYPSLYSEISGSSKSSDIKDFQSWYNENKGGKLIEDGKWGKNTSSAWSKGKTDYTKYLKDVSSRGTASKVNDKTTTENTSKTPSTSTSTSTKPERKKININLTDEQKEQIKQGGAALLAQIKAKRDAQANTVCGRKLLLKKNRASWDKCVAEQNTQNPLPDDSRQDTLSDNEKKPFFKTGAGIAVISGIVLIGAFVVYKIATKNKSVAITVPTT